MSDTENKMKQIVSEVIGVNISQLSDDIGPGDLPQWDSLGHQDIALGWGFPDEPISSLGIPSLIYRM